MGNRKDLTDEQLISIYKAYVVRGSAQKQDLIKGIMENAECTPPIAYRILYDHSYLFEFDERTKTYHLCLKYWYTLKEAESTSPQQSQSANSFLDKVVIFVSTRPNPEDFLILVGTLRDQRSDGILDNFDRLEVLLEQRLGDEVRSLVETSKSIRETLGKRTETVIQKTTETEISNISKITEEKEENKMVQMV